MIDLSVITDSIAGAGVLGSEALAKAMIEPLLPTFVGLFLVIFISQIILTFLLVEQGFGKMLIVIGVPLILGVFYIIFSTFIPVVPTLTMRWDWLVGLLS